ncbi:MAG TPA: hypothetical protein VE153_32595 [Myxococcus sp.]|nr:hypothetical protein [Myxococcus sp.]
MSAERHAPWALLCLLLAACAPPSRPTPELHRVVPGAVLNSEEMEGHIEGAALFARLEDAFWSSSPAALDTGFRVWVGEEELPPGAVTQVSASRLGVRFPAGLPVGLHAVTVTTPEGLSATRPDALEVVDRSTTRLSIESAPDGSGQPVGARRLQPGGVALELHAVLRAPSRRFVRLEPVAWTLTADVGTLTPSTDGGSATLAPLRAGTARAVATPTDSSAETRTGDLRVAPLRVLALVSSPARGKAGACLGPFVLETRDATGASAPVVLDTPVALGAQPSGVTFHPDAGCSTTSLATVTLPAGTAQAAVWLRAPAPGTFTLQADTEWEGSATWPLEVVRPVATRLVFATLEAQPSGRPFPVSLTALSEQEQVDSEVSAPVSLTLQGGGTLTCEAGCEAPFSAGRWSGMVSVTGTPGDGRTLGASAATVAGTSNAFRLLATRTPPLARPRALQPVVRTDLAVDFDASASTDRESPAATLRYSWDFNGTSTLPPPWTPWSTNPTARFTYGGEGYRLARLAVMDPDGDIGYAALLVVTVRSSVEVCVVDAPSATADDGATHCTTAKGPDGRLSLAEALKILGNNRQGYKAIRIAPGVTVSGPATFTLSDSIWLMGSVGSVLDRVSFTVPSGLALILGSLEYRGPSAVQGTGTIALETVEMRGGASVTGAGPLYLLHSRLSGCTGACVTMSSAASALYARDSTLVDSAIGLEASGCSSTGVDVAGLVFARNTTGVRIGNACTSSRLVGVTFDGNVTGLELGAGTAHELRNALFTRNTSAATCGNAASVQGTALLCWSNGTDGCLPASSLLPRANPRYIAADAEDYRLEPWSPAVNAGTPLPLDTNGAAPGNHTGAAPDLGGRETW